MNENKKVDFEEALEKAAFVCVAYGTTIIIPASTCELETSVTQRGFLAAGPIIGQYFQSLTMLSECVPARKRNMVVLLASCWALLGQGIMAVLAIPIIPLTFSIPLPTLGIYWNSWRTLLMVYSVPSIVSAVWLGFMQESPKFMYSKGRVDEALQILQKIHKINHLGSPEEFGVINRVGRRNMVIIIASVCGLCGIAVNLVHNVFASGIFFLIFLFGIVVMGLYTAIAVSLFPTHLRALAVSLSISGGRIGTFATVQILNQLLESNCEAGFYGFASIFALVQVGR
ncbi:unnamed protein product [Leptidea sinapis]|uniref:Major facilitator superfamily (MFS) profile domain-containing protein n=1 Tax=Leptidea sinapis TaxID=189913 RepID=A0A5E4QV54_9NEOP|nr:unnamed protein product [Leptidea sinapis]